MKLGFRLRRMPLVMAVVVMLAGACGSDSPEAARDTTAPEEEPTEPQELRPVSIQFDWVADSQYTPALLAEERGYFADEGLEPSFTEGGGAVSAAQIVGTGRADIGIGTLDEVPLAIQEGMDLKAVAIIEPVSPSAVIVRADSEIQKPEDLNGKTIGTLAGAASGTLFEPFLQAVGVEPGSVEKVNVPFPSQVPLLLEGKFDGITGFTRAQGAIAEVQGADVRMFLYSDHGIEFVSTGIYTRTEVIEEDPELVAGVVRAVLKGLKDLIEDPSAGVAVGARDYPAHYENMEYAELHAQMFTQFVAEQSSSRGLGYQEAEVWEKTVDLLKTHFGVEDPLPPEEYYTNEFIPDLE